MNTRNTRESIIEAMQAWAHKYGEPPTATNWHRASYDHPSDAGVLYVFGSWNAAVAAAGFTPRPAYGTGSIFWTRERIVVSIQAWAAEHGRTPKLHEWKRGTPTRPSYSSVIGRFGSWNEAMRAAGFEGRTPYGPGPWRAWDREQIRESFLDFLLTEGRWPAARDCGAGSPSDRKRVGSLPHYKALVHHFGGLNAAKTYAGWDGTDPRCKKRPVANPNLCKGCGGDLESNTFGCDPCTDRRIKRAKRARDAAHRLRENEARRARHRRAHTTIREPLEAADERRVA